MKWMILALALCAAPAAAQPSAQPAVPAAPDYSSESSWLCRPGRADPCALPLPTADLNPGGFGPVGRSAPAADPPIDCFYVYPTVSRDPGMNSDLAATEEVPTAIAQLARFASVCRTFAPLYRQVTLGAIPLALAGQDVGAYFDLAYGDVRAAWRHYLDHDNHGRPFVLIGHSQGTIHLTRLLAEEIENSPAAARMLSALLIGYAVEVPEGALVGGSLRRTPLCTRPGETGCVVTYMSFRAESPPGEGALMGRATRAGMTAGCVNPAALGGGSAPLDSYVPSAVGQFGGPAIVWSTTGPAPATFLHINGLVSGECRHDGKSGYLAITVNADPNDARTDRIPGDVYFGPQLIPGWGLHIADISLTQGDLIRLVAAQRDAFLSEARARRSE